VSYTSPSSRSFQAVSPVFQPQDVGLQRVTKHKLKQSMLEYLVRCHQGGRGHQRAHGRTRGSTSLALRMFHTRDVRKSCRHGRRAYEYTQAQRGHSFEMEGAAPRIDAASQGLARAKIHSRVERACAKLGLRAQHALRQRSGASEVAMTGCRWARPEAQLVLAGATAYDSVPVEARTCCAASLPALDAQTHLSKIRPTCVPYVHQRFQDSGMDAIQRRCLR
jgi:hypothetical protein